MKFAHFDPFSGVSGDMILGSLVDAGLNPADLEAELAKLKVKGFRLHASKVSRGPISATKLDVVIDPSAPELPEHPSEIEAIILGSGLRPAVREHAAKTVRILAEAEARVHGTAHGHVHFHEVGRLDALVDIAGAAAGLDLLGIESVTSSPVATGRGEVACSHGLLPVPAPATVEILKGIPTSETAENRELATPTGVAILKAHCSAFGRRPRGTFTDIGYGAGSRSDGRLPNVLRVFIGFENAAWETMFQLEVNLDDVTPQAIGALYETLFSKGAVDVWVTPAFMKKNRPGFVVSALCPLSAVRDVEHALFTETSTLGVRCFEADRTVLDREIIEVETKFGRIRIKVGRIPGGGSKYAPEYEDCLAAAKKHGVPLREVILEAEAGFKGCAED